MPTAAEHAEKYTAFVIWETHDDVVVCSGQILGGHLSPNANCCRTPAPPTPEKQKIMETKTGEKKTKKKRKKAKKERKTEKKLV